MPPKLGQVRRGIAPEQTEVMVSRQAGDPLMLPKPLYWDTPPWHRWPVLLTQCVFEGFASRGILVSALQSELGLATPIDDSVPSPGSPDADVLLPRMLPYRNERYGLSDADWDHAKVVDIQLSPPRDVTGRIAYSAEQIGRWELTAEDQPLSGGGWVPAMTLPPDVPSPDKLAAKVSQIRTLCPGAAVVISVTPEWLENSFEDLVAAAPDALVIRLSQLRIAGTSLARFLLRLNQRIETDSRLPLWLSPPRSQEGIPVSVSDSIKLIALGASAIAVDSWLEHVIEELDEVPNIPSIDADPKAKRMVQVEEILQRLLDPQLELFTGLYSSLIHDRPCDLLGTFDPDVANLLGLPCIGQF
ncbi:hypothetical protein [Neorhodopirellula lusitana]|nr:hypothetical protein [Neorhodopirellula lusitana]